MTATLILMNLINFTPTSNTFFLTQVISVTHFVLEMSLLLQCEVIFSRQNYLSEI